MRKQKIEHLTKMYEMWKHTGRSTIPGKQSELFRRERKDVKKTKRHQLKNYQLVQFQLVCLWTT